MNANSPPAGQWFCPACSVRGPFSVLIKDMESISPKPFLLPPSIRNRFEGVELNEDGQYDEVFHGLRPGASRTK
jgi:hypothetical protein